VAIDEVQLLRIDLRLVDLDLAGVLLDEGRLRVELLRRDRVLRDELPVPREIELRIRQRRLILGELALRLFERGLIRPRVDLREEIALLDDLPFLKPNLLQLAGDLRLHRHRG